MTTPADDARSDLAYLHGVLARAESRVDPHAFHFVHWGFLVLVYFPLANWFQREGRPDLVNWTSLAALALGIVLSVVREKRLEGRSRLDGADGLVAHQVMAVAIGSVGAGVVLSIAGPATGFVAGSDAPVLWGLAYAALAGGVSVVYRREFAWSAALILAASVAAMAVPAWNGTILGPAMGLGLAVPGIRAERRVRRLAREGHAASVA